VLYVTELMGLLLIFSGYRACLQGPQPVAAAPRATPAEKMQPA
jgi:hypothetical protein